MNTTLNKFLERFVLTDDKHYAAQILPDSDNWAPEELEEQANELISTHPKELAVIKARQVELGRVSRADTVGLQKATLQIDPIWFYDDLGQPRPLGTIKPAYRQLIEKINSTTDKDGDVVLTGYTLLSKQRALDMMTKIAVDESKEGAKSLPGSGNNQSTDGIQFGLQ